MSEVSEISAEAARLVREWAGPRQLGDSAKALIVRAARRLGFSYSRTKALYYREARVISAVEMDTLRRRQREKTAHDVFSELTALVVEAQTILHRAQLDSRIDRPKRPVADAQGRAVAD